MINKTESYYKGKYTAKPRNGKYDVYDKDDPTFKKSFDSAEQVYDWIDIQKATPVKYDSTLYDVAKNKNIKFEGSTPGEVRKKIDYYKALNSLENNPKKQGWVMPIDVSSDVKNALKDTLNARIERGELDDLSGVDFEKEVNVMRMQISDSLKEDSLLEKEKRRNQIGSQMKKIIELPDEVSWDYLKKNNFEYYDDGAMVKYNPTPKQGYEKEYDDLLKEYTILDEQLQDTSEFDSIFSQTEPSKEDSLLSSPETLKIVSESKISEGLNKKQAITKQNVFLTNKHRYQKR